MRKIVKSQPITVRPVPTLREAALPFHHSARARVPVRERAQVPVCPHC